MNKYSLDIDNGFISSGKYNLDAGIFSSSLIICFFVKLLSLVKYLKEYPPILPSSNNYVINKLYALLFSVYIPIEGRIDRQILFPLGSNIL